MNVQRIAAFSFGEGGGNPAGVVLCEALPSSDEMQAVAAEIGYSETVFASPQGEEWRVRYFAPEIEVPFCGHATIALGAALALAEGDGVFSLRLNEAVISVEGHQSGEIFWAALQSPRTRSERPDDSLVDRALRLFGYDVGDLDARLPPAIAEAGARHLIVALKSRRLLAEMAYDLEVGRMLMHEHGLITISLIYAGTTNMVHARNPFASSGVYEDPATGAAAAALAGYLRDLGWPLGGVLDIIQGEDMGTPSRLHVELTAEIGSSIRVSGAARLM